MTVKLRDLDRIIREATGAALSEVLKPLNESPEEDLQKNMAGRLASVSHDGRSKDLEEVEDEEQPKFVKKRAILGNESEDEVEATEEPQATLTDKPFEEQLADPEIGNIIKALNILRSGKSTKDPETKKNLQAYFKDLNIGEKQALLVALDSLAKIIAKGVPSKKIPDPSQLGIDIKPAQVEEPKKRPKVKVAGAAEKSTAGRSELPIVVGESADKRKLLRIARSLRK